MSDAQQAGGQWPHDTDSQETREWLDALSAVIESEGKERAHFLLEGLLDFVALGVGAHAWIFYLDFT